MTVSALRVILRVQRWALWVFDVILRVVVPDGMVMEVLEGLPEEMVVELEGYAEGLNGGQMHVGML